MKKLSLLFLLAGGSVLVMLLAMGVGSVPIAPGDSAAVLLSQLCGIGLPEGVDEVTRSILVNIRIPRTLLAFISGVGLAISGVMMQSVLRNPLASSFTLGVSSGAALGASLAMALGISIFGYFTLPIFGLVFGLATVFLAIGLAAKIDRRMENHSIILTGMAVSLFANAMITIFVALSKDQLQRLIYWQMGSFSMKEAVHAYILGPLVLIGFLVMLAYGRQMDILTLGDEQAITSGLAVKRMKWLLLSISAVVTGAIVSIVGVIGFIDLFTPHMARRLFGASHRYVVPAAALLGGAFMVLCDLAARTMVAPLELPVGAITSALGAPFFIYLYFGKGRRSL